MKKLVGALLLVAVIGGAVAGAWWWQGRSAPAPSGEPEPPAAPITPGPAPAPAATDFAEVGCRLTVAAGWQSVEPPPETQFLPGDAPVVVLDKPSAGRLPRLVIGRVPAATLGNADPQAYPASFVKAVREQLAATIPPPTFDDAASAPKLSDAFTASAFLTARGSFRELGVAEGTGRFLAVTAADGAVYVAVGFAADDTTDQDILVMLGSLTPLPPPAESSQRQDAEEPAPMAPAPAPRATPAPSPTSPP